MCFQIEKHPLSSTTDLGTWIVSMVSGNGDNEEARNGTFTFDSIYATNSEGEGNAKTPILGALQGAFVRRKNIGGYIFNISLPCKSIVFLKLISDLYTSFKHLFIRL